MKTQMKTQLSQAVEEMARANERWQQAQHHRYAVGQLVYSIPMADWKQRVIEAEKEQESAYAAREVANGAVWEAYLLALTREKLQERMVSYMMREAMRESQTGEDSDTPTETRT